MSLKSLMQYLKREVVDTADTSAISATYQRKATIHAGCTPDTADTFHSNHAGANALSGQIGEAVNDPTAPELPIQPKKQTFMEWQDTWRALDQTYQLHHFKCPYCIAAGLGYGLRCDVGASIWLAHQSVI